MVTWSGRGWVPGATWAWAADSSPSVRAWAVAVNGPAEQGPGRPDRAAGRGASPQAEPVAEPGRGRACLLVRLRPRPPFGRRRPRAGGASGLPGGPAAAGTPGPVRPGRYQPDGSGPGWPAHPR